MWLKLDVLVKTSAKIPMSTMTDLLTLIPDPIKDVAQNLLTFYDNPQVLVPVLGPLPVILFKACVAVCQCFINHNGNMLLSSLDLLHLLVV